MDKGSEGSLGVFFTSGGFSLSIWGNFDGLDHIISCLLVKIILDGVGEDSV